MPLLANWMRLSRAVVYRTVSQNLILPRALSNDYGPADYKSAIQRDSAECNSALRDEPPSFNHARGKLHQ